MLALERHVHGGSVVRIKWRRMLGRGRRRTRRVWRWRWCACNNIRIVHGRQEIHSDVWFGSLEIYVRSTLPRKELEPYRVPGRQHYYAGPHIFSAVIGGYSVHLKLYIVDLIFQHGRAHNWGKRDLVPYHAPLHLGLCSIGFRHFVAFKNCPYGFSPIVH